MLVGKKTLSAWIMLGAAWQCQLAYSVEFNLDVLDVNERDKVDLSRFSVANYIMPGQYVMTLNVNGRSLSELTLNFYASEQDQKVTRACLSSDLVKSFGLKEEVLEKLGSWHQQECAALDEVPGVKVRPDLESGALYVSIPQAWMEYRDVNWSSIAEWDNGIPGALLDYSINTSTSKGRNGARARQASGNGTAGFNVGAWRFRGDFQGSSYRGQGMREQSFSWSNVYAFRPLPKIGARAQVGRTYLSSNLFESFRYLGVNLMSDDQMLPPNLRGYAPEVTGVAGSNAKVTIRQGERVLYETTVPPGPFRIRDINSAVSGKLDVEIAEDDGNTQHFQIETANIPYLSRPGRVRYNLSTGRPISYDGSVSGPMFGSGEVSWGVNSDWSVFGGGLLANGYRSLAGGIGRNLGRFGVVSTDITHAQAEMPAGQRRKGSSLRVNYAKRFDEYNSEITFAGYRFSQRSFTTVEEFLAAHEGEKAYRDNKSTYTILANKSFTSIGLSGHLSYTRNEYWNDRPSERMSLFLSRYFDAGRVKGASATLSLSHTQEQDGRDNSISLSLSIPLGSGSQGGRVGFDTSASNGHARHRASYSNYGNGHDYMLSATQDQFGSGVQGYYTHRGPWADVGLNGSYQDQGSQSVGLSMQGGVTVTAKGAAVHRSAYDGGSRILVDTEGVAGVPLQNGEARSNAMGVAVVPVTNNYYRTDVRVDVNALSDDIEALKSVTEASLTEGAIGYRKLSIVQGSKAMVVLQLPDGSYPPFGASVVNALQYEVGIVDEGGQVYLSGIKPQATFEVRWGGGVQCLVTAPINLNVNQRPLLICRPVPLFE